VIHLVSSDSIAIRELLNIPDAMFVCKILILSKRTMFYHSRNLKVFLADLITCDHIVHLTALSLNFYGKQKV
jgi:hypothetical protein